jgi:hypothetical protein
MTFRPRIPKRAVSYNIILPFFTLALYNAPALNEF